MAKKRPKVLSERTVKWLLKLFPPLLLQRIQVREVGPGCRSCRLRVKRSLLTRNLHGTIFGGTIFSAVDPIYAVLYWQVLAREGLDVEAWLRSASIEYLQPAASHLTCEFRVEDEDVREVKEELASTGRFSRDFETEVVDANGEVCALVRSEIYGRMRRNGAGS